MSYDPLKSSPFFRLAAKARAEATAKVMSGTATPGEHAAVVTTARPGRWNRSKNGVHRKGGMACPRAGLPPVSGSVFMLEGDQPRAWEQAAVSAE